MTFSRQNQIQHSKPGTLEYEQHIREEIEHYAEVFKEGEGKETLLQPVPPSWREAERRAALLVREATGDNLDGHLIKRLNREPGMRMLSLGSGPGGLEIHFAQQAPLARVVGLDINDQLLELARQRVRALDLTVRFDQADLNTVELPGSEFDIVLCHASLHHVIELERLAEQIDRTLRPGGELITVDVVTRNGYLMWPATRDVVQALWKTLPERFRVNHTSYKEERIDNEIVDIDQSETGMECVRSQDILPTLEQAFTVVSYVPYFSITRRFFDTMYGPNYDLSLPLDRAIFDWIWEL